MTYNRHLIPCGDRDCRNEGKWYPAEGYTRDDLRQRIGNRWDSDAKAFVSKPEGVTEDEIDAAVARSVVCGVHGPGVQKRRRYGSGTEYVPIGEAERDAVLRAKQVQRAEAEQRLQEQQDKSRLHHQRVALYQWRELDAERGYTLRREGDKWSIYDDDAIAALDRGDWASDEWSVQIERDEPYDDVIRPSNIDQRVRSVLTAKIAPLVAQALTEAAARLDEINASARQRHDAAITGWDMDRVLAKEDA